MTNDANHPTGPHREGNGLRRCIEECIRSVRLKPEDISCIKLNGSGSPYSDASEYQALEHVFGQHLKNIPCFCIKSLIGHLQGASGLIETIITVEQMEKGVIPGMPKDVVETLEFELNLADHDREMEGGNCLLLYSGFGGQNACLILEKHNN